MTHQNESPDADQEDYNAALGLMQEGLHRAAQNKLQALIDRYHAAPDTIRPGLAADAMCTLAVSQRENGDFEDALQTFKQTSMLFAHNTTDEAKYVAGMADLLAARLYYEQGRPQDSHLLLDHMSLRIMMEEHPKFRALFDEAMSQKNALERQHGFESGAGIRLDRFDIGRDDPPPVSPTPLVEPPPIERTATPPPLPTESGDPGYFYQKIESKFEATPHSWQLAPGGLVVTRYGNAVEFPYPQITRLSLRFAPTKLKKHRYTVCVTHQNGASAEIDNMSFRGLGDFEDLSFKYAILVHGLSQKLAAAGAPCEVHGGVSWLWYLLTLGLSAIILMVLLMIVLLGGPILILIKVLLIALYIPTMYRWLKHNRPRQGTLTLLPDGTVPPLIP